MLTNLKNLTQNKQILSSIGIFLTSFTTITSANAGPTLNPGGGAGFGIFTKWLQNWIDFMTGPFGMAAVITSIILAFVVWAYAPKEGIMAPILRTVVVGIVILNVGAFVSTFS